MNFKVLSLNEKNDWLHYFLLLPEAYQDIYYTPEYYSLYEELGDGEAKCFLFEKEGKIAIYPFLLNSVNDLGYKLDNEYFDIQGAYGYNGWVSTTNDNNFLKEFGEYLNKWCIDNNIIAEFTRFNPVIRNEKLSINYFNTIESLDNVLIPVYKGLDYLWNNSFDSGVRKAIKKAQRNNVLIKVFEGSGCSEVLIEKFCNIYYSTMNRNNADDYYFFEKSFLHKMFQKLKNNIILTFAYLDDIAISTELVFFSKINSYGFLGGTNKDYYNISPNSLLRYDLIKNLIIKGIKYYSIGGSSKKNDSIFKFKKSFAKNEISTFFIGTKIHHKQIYDKVVRQWEKKFPEKKEKYKNYILKYRY